MKKEEEYKEIFLAEAQENFAEVNRLLTLLEKDPGDAKTLNAIFRITHTLKGNATGMGYDKIADMAHVLEDFFGLVREGKIVLENELFAVVFKAADAMGDLINAIREPRDVKYRGIKTKLEVLINAQKNDHSEIKTDDRTEEDANDSSESESKIIFSDLVQVPVRKLDNLLNLVGELIIERDRILSTLGSNGTTEVARLTRVTSDLQYSVMDVRLVQVDFLFNKFHRIVRDAAAAEQKSARLKLEGTETEIDRNILQVISDSLIHIIRNAIGHGIELPDERRKAGKPDEGVIVLRAVAEADSVILEIIDDGAGIDVDKVRAKVVSKGLLSYEESLKLSDNEIIAFIFEPGFSTMEEVTSIAGRGVGMDVVKRALDSIGGIIQVSSMKGQGTRMSMRLPSSMAVKSTLLFELNLATYAIPLSFTESVVSLYKEDVSKAAGGLITVHLNRTIPVLFLSDLVANTTNSPVSFHRVFDRLHPEQKLEIVVVRFNDKYLGLVVDKLLQQKEIVEKPLRKPVDYVKLVGGTTILGNGTVCMVLNVPAIINLYFTQLAALRSKAVGIKE